MSVWLAALLMISAAIEWLRGSVAVEELVAVRSFGNAVMLLLVTILLFLLNKGGF